MPICFNKFIGKKVGYKQYDCDSPWMAPIRLINKKEEAITQASYERVAFAVGGSVVYQNDMDEARYVLEYRFDLNENMQNMPDFLWYQKTFPNNYSTGEAPTRVPDANAESTVKMPN